MQLVLCVQFRALNLKKRSKILSFQTGIARDLINRCPVQLPELQPFPQQRFEERHKKTTETPPRRNLQKSVRLRMVAINSDTLKIQSWELKKVILSYKFFSPVNLRSLCTSFYHHSFFLSSFQLRSKYLPFESLFCLCCGGQQHRLSATEERTHLQKPVV